MGGRLAQVAAKRKRLEDATVQAGEDAKRRRVPCPQGGGGPPQDAGREGEEGKIVLLSNHRHTAREIVAKLDCNERTALKWIGCFNRHGVAGLEEGPREGRPRVYGPEDVGTVIQAALTPGTRPALRFLDAGPTRGLPQRGEGRRHGTHQGRGDALERGPEVEEEGEVVRREGGPGVRRKKGAIERLYASPPADSVVLCVDEMGPLSARSYPGRELVPRLEQGRAGRAKQELELDRNRRMGGYESGSSLTGSTCQFPRRLLF